MLENKRFLLIVITMIAIMSFHIKGSAMLETPENNLGLRLIELNEQIQFLCSALATNHEKEPENNPEYWRKISNNAEIRKIIGGKLSCK